jgi:hypothetical protein
MGMDLNEIRVQNVELHRTWAGSCEHGNEPAFKKSDEILD